MCSNWEAAEAAAKFCEVTEACRTRNKKLSLFCESVNKAREMKETEDLPTTRKFNNAVTLFVFAGLGP